MIASLSNVAQVTFRLHTAGLTTSAFGEREMLALEQRDDIAAAERRPLALQQVINHYEMNGIFAHTSLRYVRIEYVDEASIRRNTRGDPTAVIFQLQQYLIDGFRLRNLTIVVEVVRVS